MKYISTRGGDGPLGYEDALLSGLARDGGLFVPAEWPRLSRQEWLALKGKSYAEVAVAIMSSFTGDDVPRAELTAMVEDTYAAFTDPAVAPLKPIGDNIHVCELFHGPTIAFKDYAMQFLSRAFDRALSARGKRAVILGATSGDTGSAALEAFQGRDFVDIFILFPDGRVSPIQQRQMTSVLADGAYAVAVEGDFDDCQDAVKALFRDLEFRDRVGLSAINSINWARLMPQIVYYVTTALELGAPDQEVAFAVPTGNFGNIFAGYAAKQMGLPISTLICASNRNDILTRFFESGAMERQSVEPSLSPSMDIQVSSNFERLLFEMLDRDAEAVKTAMATFAETGRFDVEPAVLDKARTLFQAWRLDDQGILDEIARTKAETGMVLDPHSAVGVYSARMARQDNTVKAGTPIVALACAHPAKFPDAVAKATGQTPALPPHLADLMERKERIHHVSANTDDIAALVDANKRQ
ncbi:MAG: threonine synthase [Alphaproteobacteria bacterium]|nr:threonine synthase [Alphaproteobacteria bacterium]